MMRTLCTQAPQLFCHFQYLGVLRVVTFFGALKISNAAVNAILFLKLTDRSKSTLHSQSMCCLGARLRASQALKPRSELPRYIPQLNPAINRREENSVENNFTTFNHNTMIFCRFGGSAIYLLTAI